VFVSGGYLRGTGTEKSLQTAQKLDEVGRAYPLMSLTAKEDKLKITLADKEEAAEVIKVL
jgi:hypothetical protein